MCVLLSVVYWSFCLSCVDPYFMFTDQYLISYIYMRMNYTLSPKKVAHQTHGNNFVNS